MPPPEPEQAPPPFVADLAYRNRVYEVLLDAALMALAYYAAFRVRFQGADFTQFLPYFFVVTAVRAGLPARGAGAGREVPPGLARVRDRAS